MSNRISQGELESYLWGAATLLRGTIDAGEYKAFIFAPTSKRGETVLMSSNQNH